MKSAALCNVINGTLCRIYGTPTGTPTGTPSHVSLDNVSLDRQKQKHDDQLTLFYRLDGR